MSISITAARRRRRFWLASSFLAPIVLLASPGAYAQQPPSDQLPPIEVSPPVDQNRTRAQPTYDESAGPRRVAPNTAPANTPNPAPGTGSNVAPSTSSGGGSGGRQFSGIVGASSTVITADDIAHSPGQTVQDVLAQVPGVQLQSFYGGVNGVGTTVDMRGFGAFATANTLILINGRRVNDIDLAGVDLSTIPLNSIERIEITRGNSGAVLYGDNAVGGVINIVTKTGVGGPPVAIRGEAGVGSFNARLASVSAATNSGPWSTSFFGNGFKSDGYRDNNHLDQRNGVGDIHYTTPDLTAFLTLSGDDQKLGLPGGRIVDPGAGINELVTARQGTSTPFDYANKQGANVTAGFTKSLWNGADLIVDGGVRDKKQQAGFFGSDPSIPFNYVDTHLQTWSITPRLSIKNSVLGVPSTVLTGIDYYDATYHSDRPEFKGAPPIHVYDLSQQTLAGYWQHTVGLLPSTDFSYGARVQNTSLSARDRYDPTAPGAFDIQAMPLDSNETQYAAHVGVEHRFTDVFSVFGRAAHAFRTPDVDERVASGPSFDFSTGLAVPQTFRLKTQTSSDVEGGFRVKTNIFQVQTSVYNMDLENEIHFDPVNFFNYNLDPTRRYGAEASASVRVSDSVLLRGGMAYTRAVFREGPFAGADVPLVSRYTTNAGVTWNILQNYLVFDATLRGWSSRIMDNDQANLQTRIPANATADFKLSGQYEHFFWSLRVNNVLNALYYDYAIASSFTAGRFSAYPLPGRTYMVKAGATF
jgi:iron complex outermembrane receptor protein